MLPLVASDTHSHDMLDTDELFEHFLASDFNNETNVKMWRISALNNADHGSIGPVDERRPVLQEETEYNAVVSLSIDGNNICTGTIVEFEGYQATKRGSIIATAAHCLKDVDPSNIVMHGDYQQNNVVWEYAMQAEGTWIHPFYEDYNIGVSEGHVDSRADIGLIFTTTVTPAQVKPALFEAVDLEKFWRDIEKDFNSATQQQQEHTSQSSRITMAGFSGDKSGLTTHERVDILSFNRHSVITSVGDISPRASGGPNFEVDETGGAIKLNSNGQPVVFAVNSGVQPHTNTEPQPEKAFSTALDNIMLLTVPFLQAKETGYDACFPAEQQATVTVAEDSGLNRRYGPATDHGMLAELEDKPSALKAGDVVTIHADYTNHLGQQWALVTGPDGRTGFTSKNYLKYQDRHCLKF